MALKHGGHGHNLAGIDAMSNVKWRAYGGMSGMSSPGVKSHRRLEKGWPIIVSSFFLEFLG